MVEKHVQIRTVEFPVEGGGTAAAFEARPNCVGACPAVLIVHEWWGLNDHIKDIAGRLAQEGFLALAPDLFVGKATTDAKEAGALMQNLNVEEAVRILKGGVKFLREKEPIYAEHIGVLGFCMGGSYALLLAAREPSLKAAVVFYGDLPEPAEQAQNIRCPVLFIGAGKDPWINAAKVDRIRETFHQYGVNSEVRVYADAQHAFFNDTRPEVYNSADAHDAWTRALGLFNRTLKS